MTPSTEVLQTVLLVEDNAEIRTFVQHTLEEGGLEVLVAADAAAAVQIEGQFARAIHLLLSDVMMPGISGPELAKKLKQQRPEMRVMLMSGYSKDWLILLRMGLHPKALPAEGLDGQSKRRFAQRSCATKPRIISTP